MTTAAPLPPAGWYPDPGGDRGVERWWDGQRWTAGLRPASWRSQDRGVPSLPASGPGWEAAPVATNPADSAAVPPISPGWATPPQHGPGPDGTAPPPPGLGWDTAALPPHGPGWDTAAGSSQGPRWATPPPQRPGWSGAGAGEPSGSGVAPSGGWSAWPPGPPSPVWAGWPPGGPGPTGSDGVGPPVPVIPARAAWWALLGFVVAEVFAVALATVADLVTGSDTDAVTTLAGEIGLWAGLIGTCIFVSRRYGSGSLRRDFSLRFRPIDIAFGIGAAVAGFVLSIFVSALFENSRFRGSNTQFISGQKHNSAGFAIAALIASVGAPFFEELFFRGFLRTALSARLGPIGAIWAQAACFGLAHFQATSGWGNVSVVVVIGGLGAVLGYTAHRTGRLGAGMVAHGLFNTVVTIIILTT